MRSLLCLLRGAAKESARDKHLGLEISGAVLLREVESSVARCSPSIRTLLMTAVFHVRVALVWLCIHHVNVFE